MLCRPVLAVAMLHATKGSFSLRQVVPYIQISMFNVKWKNYNKKSCKKYTLTYTYERSYTQKVQTHFNCSFSVDGAC